MKEKGRKASSTQSKRTKQPSGNDRKERIKPSVKDYKPPHTEEPEQKTSLLESEGNTNVDSSDVFDDISIHYVDDMSSSEGMTMVDAEDELDDLLDDEKESSQEVKLDGNGKDEDERISDALSPSKVLNGNENDKDDANENEKDDVSSDGCREVDSEGEGEDTKDSALSQEETEILQGNKLVERASRVPKNLTKKSSSESTIHISRGRTNRQGATLLQYKSTPRRSHKGDLVDEDIKFKNMKVHAVASSESDGSEDKSNGEIKGREASEEAFSSSRVDVNEEIDVMKEKCSNEDERRNQQKIQEMEQRIDQLEEELREIAALEISLYSVVPEHGSSSHKVHTPARRLSRLYIHACKHWTPGKKGSIAKNSASGLVLIAKSCGSDISRLTFWLSNTVVLREVITQAFGGAHQAHLQVRLTETNDWGNWKANGMSKHGKAFGFMQFMNDWQETSTFVVALEKIESWIFSRIVESVWWQTLTPHMQSPVEEVPSEKIRGHLLEPTLSGQQQGSFSVNQWKSAFQEAFQRLCPVRAGGHDCGCLPVLARMVMEQCVARIDVAMFNAILRESAYEIPTDPVSDPFVNSKVLPIPDGNLSFGSGAQLKNSIGSWSRYLMDLFGRDAGNVAPASEANGGGEDDRQGDDEMSKYFHLLNALSDLLMLPKDLLLDRTIRKEVCPTLGLPIIKRILCNFAPDEFCPDPVPGYVLETLNSETILERRQSDKDLINCFPCSTAPVTYCPPSPAEVAGKIGELGQPHQLGRNVSSMQAKGCTSDEELDELDSPLTSIIDKTISPRQTLDSEKQTGSSGHHCSSTLRYDLLREVWHA